MSRVYRLTLENAPPPHFSTNRVEIKGDWRTASEDPRFPVVMKIADGTRHVHILAFVRVVLHGLHADIEDRKLSKRLGAIDKLLFELQRDAKVDKGRIVSEEGSLECEYDDYGDVPDEEEQYTLTAKDPL